jgi:hypothetical protein
VGLVSVRATRLSEDSGQVAPPDAEGVARLLNTAMDQVPELGLRETSDTFVRRTARDSN